MSTQLQYNAWMKNDELQAHSREPDKLETGMAFFPRALLSSRFEQK
ncbi:hypothetical protein SAMN04488054_11065 [Salibacterium qingdaonense]|uniref:Uncharacterized protein n=1 Tax=Salibacterium qingdaonense TaxID=266892 RepID=A0A1I4M682_9BACI|nr:hypothetical protein SAMN04488054_11065 [Salibacterium qingdaonense]